ncbi:hypothetical protein DMUE_5372 [Dictyocoela muelleri]|nr:hypothetical protein DMUE_5372 [Dictyocoela muelleri]
MDEISKIINDYDSQKSSKNNLSQTKPLQINKHARIYEDLDILKDNIENSKDNSNNGNIDNGNIPAKENPKINRSDYNEKYKIAYKNRLNNTKDDAEKCILNILIGNKIEIDSEKLKIYQSKLQVKIKSIEDLIEKIKNDNSNANSNDNSNDNSNANSKNDNSNYDNFYDNKTNCVNFNYNNSNYDNSNFDNSNNNSNNNNNNANDNINDNNSNNNSNDDNINDDNINDDFVCRQSFFKNIHLFSEYHYAIIEDYTITFLLKFGFVQSLARNIRFAWNKLKKKLPKCILFESFKVIIRKYRENQLQNNETEALERKIKKHRVHPQFRRKTKKIFLTEEEKDELRQKEKEKEKRNPINFKFEKTFNDGNFSNEKSKFQIFLERKYKARSIPDFRIVGEKD